MTQAHITVNCNSASPPSYLSWLLTREAHQTTIFSALSPLLLFGFCSYLAFTIRMINMVYLHVLDTLSLSVQAQERKAALRKVPEQAILAEVRRMVEEMQNLNKKLEETVSFGFTCDG